MILITSGTKHTHCTKRLHYTPYVQSVIGENHWPLSGEYLSVFGPCRIVEFQPNPGAKFHFDETALNGPDIKRDCEGHGWDEYV